MLRTLVFLLFALSSALASPARTLVDQYVEFVTRYYVDADSINAAAFRTRLQGVLKSRCGTDAACPTTAVYEDLKTITKGLPDGGSIFLSPLDLNRVIQDARAFTLGIELRGEIVYRVVGGSSAERAGLRRGDRVLGTPPAPGYVDARPVTLRVERDGKALEVTLTPALLQNALLNPETRLLEGNIAYLRIPSWRAPGSAQRIHSALSALQSRAPKGLIVDLRFNAGGYLEDTLLTLAAFLGDGAVLQLQSRSATVTYSLRALGLEASLGENVKRNTVEYGVAWRTRVVVLTNASTSSAAEVFALAMKRGGSSIVGEATAGRARYAALPIKLSDGSELRLAVTRNAYPNGDPMPLSVTPDVVVKDDPAALARGADPVLEAGMKALE
jgi:carboxyl-terminal processing protease